MQTTYKIIKNLGAVVLCVIGMFFSACGREQSLSTERQSESAIENSTETESEKVTVSFDVNIDSECESESEMKAETELVSEYVSESENIYDTSMKESPSEEKFHFIDIDNYYFVSSDAQVYSYPGDDVVLGTLKYASVVYAIAFDYENGWAKIIYNDAEGYVPLSCMGGSTVYVDSLEEKKKEYRDKGYTIIEINEVDEVDSMLPGMVKYEKYVFFGPDRVSKKAVERAFNMIRDEYYYLLRDGYLWEMIEYQGGIDGIQWTEYVIKPNADLQPSMESYRNAGYDVHLVLTDSELDEFIGQISVDEKYAVFCYMISGNVFYDFPTKIQQWNLENEKNGLFASVEMEQSGTGQHMVMQVTVTKIEQ